MKTILITGFDPFDGEEVNPSYEVVKLLKDEINGVSIIKKEIPTEFYKSKEVMLSLIEEYKPDAIINVGQAGGRDKVSLESTAYNLIEAKIPDNGGRLIKSSKISLSGSDTFSTTLPLDKIHEALLKEGIPSYISDNPGRFVCNYIMYSMLELTRDKNTISGFIHVPYLKEQVENKTNVPYMEISDMVKALNVTIETIIKNLVEA